jgi:hypothetical protein
MLAIRRDDELDKMYLGQNVPPSTRTPRKCSYKYQLVWAVFHAMGEVS